MIALINSLKLYAWHEAKKQSFEVIGVLVDRDTKVIEQVFLKDIAVIDPLVSNNTDPDDWVRASEVELSKEPRA